MLLLVAGTGRFSRAHAARSSTGHAARTGGWLFLAIGGSTVLNMWHDRDINWIMHEPAAGRCRRGAGRAVSGNVHEHARRRLGTRESSRWPADRFARAVLRRCHLHAVAETAALGDRLGRDLRRHTGVSRTCTGLGSVDWIGVLLASSVLIPTHILTFAMRHDGDYRRANVPTIASVYGFPAARWVIASWASWRR